MKWLIPLLLTISLCICTVSAAELTDGAVIAESDTVAELNAGVLTFTDTKTGMGVTTSALVNGAPRSTQSLQMRGMQNLMGEEGKSLEEDIPLPTLEPEFVYEVQGNRVKETITLYEDVVLSFPVTITKPSL